METKSIFVTAACVFGFCLAAFALSATAQAPASDPAASEVATVKEMNGYALEDYADFWKNPAKWHFVTVRYRKDSGEMRLTYANDIAWKALQAGGTDFPDGSVFGKIGLLTHEDPAFTSSAVPTSARRYQLMVKDKKKWPETDGWGYALFDWRGLAVREDQDIAAQACHACHALVPERDYVFSQPFQLEIGAQAPVPQTGALPRVDFGTVDFSTLPEKARAKMPKGAKQARVVQGDMAQKLFRGTIDEIRPTLAKEALRAGMPAALVSEDGTLFSVMYADNPPQPCLPSTGMKGLRMHSLYTTGNFPGRESHVVDAEYCEENGK